jgi:hypothetical protein
MVLTNPDFEDLKFGRVITAASVIRPDFDWDSQDTRRGTIRQK